MKKARHILSALLVAAGLTFVSGPRPAYAETTYSADLVSDTCIAQNTNYDLPLQDISVISFVAAYSTTTPSADTFTDGRKSTASITVSLNNDLAARVSTATIDVMSASTSTLYQTDVTLNGARFQAGPGGEWTAVQTATGNAVALAAAINTAGVWTAVVSSTRITITSISSGTHINGWTLSTDSTACYRLNGGTSLTSNPVGGRDAAKIGVNGVLFDNGDEWSTGSTSSATAKSISDALMANSTVNAVIVSTWTSTGVVFATATAVGDTAYALFTSTPNALKVNGSASSLTGTFGNGSDSKVALATDLITLGGHGYGTGLDVLYTVSGSTGIGGLTANTTYFVIKNDYDRVKLATTKALATAGTGINLTDQPGGQTYTLTPVARSGNPSFNWQVSNNNSTYFDLAVTTITVTTSDSTGWNLGSLPYKTLRLKYLAPTKGCASITATGTGTR